MGGTREGTSSLVAALTLPVSPEHAEADTFFCFTNLMAEIRDNFIKSLDDSQCGITYKMEKVYSTLKDKDVELYLKLVRTLGPHKPGQTGGKGRGQQPSWASGAQGKVWLDPGVESGCYRSGALAGELGQDCEPAGWE